MKNRIQKILVVCGVLLALYLLNFINSAKPPSERVKEIISQHRAVIILVKSGTQNDKKFLYTLKEIRPKLKGMGSIVIADRNAGFLESGEEPPVMIILDSHGNQMHRFLNVIDKQLLEEAIHAIVTHHH